MATVYCRNCGNEVRGKFCTTCGTPVQDGAAEQAGAPDAGATTVIRAEDLQRMAAQESASTVPPSNTGPAASTSPWPEQSQSSPWPQQQDSTSSGWAQPGADQSGQSQWGQLPGGQSNQGWQQPPPQWGQSPGGGQQTYGAPPPQSNYYSQPGGVGTAMATAPAPSTDIGQLFSGAWNILMSRINQVVQIALIYAAALAVAGIVMGMGVLIGSKVGFIGVLFDLIGFIAILVVSAIPVAAYIYLAQDAQNGNSSTVQNLLERARAVLPNLAVALVIVGIITAVASITVVGGIICAFLFIFVSQAVVLDNASPTSSLGQSFRTVTSNIGTSLVALIVLYLVLMVVSFVSMIILIPSFFLIFIPIIGWVIWLAIAGIIYGVVGAFVLSYMTLLYNGLKAQRGVMATGAPTGY